jgi:GNAT superfamily N-acetyltransferase
MIFRVNFSEPISEVEIGELLHYAVFPGPGKVAKVLDWYKSGKCRHLYGYADQGALIGVAGFRACRPVIAIHHLAVRPQYRGRGIGRALIAAILMREKPAGLIAETDASSVGFYKKLGFVIADQSEPYPGVIRFTCVYPV